MKRVLVVHYSQSGQLDNVLESFTRPLAQADDIELVFENVRPVEDFPFPWPFFRFIDTFPESVYLDPPPMQDSGLTGDEEFDLIILAYQVWFLSPSLPITGFMKSAVAKRLFQDRPVVTLIACRNMWLMAQENMKDMIAELGGRLVGNVALVDEAGSIGSFIATPAWVLSGNKGPRLRGLIPRAGVSEKDIANSSRFGARIRDVLQNDVIVDESLLQGTRAAYVNETLIFSEQTARRSFLVWGRLFRSLGPAGSPLRQALVVIYTLFLLTLIVTVVPIGIVVRKLFAPFMKKRTAKQKAYFGKPSGY